MKGYQENILYRTGEGAENRLSHTLLVEAYVSIAFLEDNLAVSKFKEYICFDPKILQFGVHHPL